MNGEEKHVCPSCTLPLERRREASGSHLACGSCHGVSINLAVLRRSVDDKVITALWQLVRQSLLVPNRQCPTCPKLLRPFSTKIGESEVQLDGCLVCQALWFDGAELDRLRAVSGRVAKPRPESGPRPSGFSAPSYEFASGIDVAGFLVDVFVEFLD